MNDPDRQRADEVSSNAEDIRLCYVLLALQRLRSLLAVARMLGRSAPTVRRWIGDAEIRWGMKLVTSDARGTRLTREAMHVLDVLSKRLRRH